MSTALPSVSSELLNIAPAGQANLFDEVYYPSGDLREQWVELDAALRETTREEFSRRSRQAAHLVRENGLTYNAFVRDGQPQRPWEIDLLPMVLSGKEWSQVESGLAQRARLLEAVIRDAYGPRELFTAGLIPPELLFGHPGYRRAFFNMSHRSDPMLTFYGAELARLPSGQFCVMADRAEAPAGAGFALENRIIVSRTISPSLGSHNIQRLAPFFMRLQNALRHLAGPRVGPPRIVLLSPGPTGALYFEDVYLARYLGYTLVEGNDLAIRDDRVYLKTLSGLAPVDVILSRGSEGGLDPLELGGGATHGVPGLLQAIRSGHVQLANSPGCGLVEAPVFMACLPRLAQAVLGQPLQLPSVPTWWCGEPEGLSYVLDQLPSLVIKPAFQASGGQEIIGATLSTSDCDAWREKIRAKPFAFVGQTTVIRSSVPFFQDANIRRGHAALRTFLVADEGDYHLMPGALVRVAPTAAPMELSINAGDCSKDLWVVSPESVEPVTLLSSRNEVLPLRRSSASFPSRIADDLYWFGQSLDRIDFLARLLRTLTDRLLSGAQPDWPEMPLLLRILAEQGQLDASTALPEFSHQVAELEDLDELLPRTVADDLEQRGIARAINELYRLASQTRPWISPDTWLQVHHAVEGWRQSLRGSPLELADLLPVLTTLILNLASVSGLIHDGMIRGPAWRLMDLGRRLERARNGLSLARCFIAGGELYEHATLKALIEIIDCRMTYRARYFDELQPNAVLDLCLTDETNPKSVLSQLIILRDHVDQLPQDSSSPLGSSEQQAALATWTTIRMLTPDQLARPLDCNLDPILQRVDDELRRLDGAITRKYLLHSGIPRQIESPPGGTP